MTDRLAHARLIPYFTLSLSTRSSLFALPLTPSLPSPIIPARARTHPRTLQERGWLFVAANSIRFSISHLLKPKPCCLISIRLSALLLAFSRGLINLVYRTADSAAAKSSNERTKEEGEQSQLQLLQSQSESQSCAIGSRGMSPQRRTMEYSSVGNRNTMEASLGPAAIGSGLQGCTVYLRLLLGLLGPCSGMRIARDWAK